MQEEPEETLGGVSNKGSMWLCPLCQESHPDRENLSHHLTDKHSVLLACLDKLLAIAAPKHPSIIEDEVSKTQNHADDTSQLNLEGRNSPSVASQNESESTDAGDKCGSSQEKELDEEIEGGRLEEGDMGGLESDQDNGEQTIKTSESSVSNGRSVCKNSVASEGDNRPFKCNACLESFPTRTALSVHYNSTTHIQRMRTGTVKDSDSTPFLARPYVSNKPYQCAVCRVSYNHAITLESHLKSVLHQSRSRSAGNATPSSTANTGTGNMVTTLAASTVGSTTQLVNASTSNCVTQANLTASAVTTKDGEQVQPQLAPSLLSSPVASAQAMSAILTLLTSSPNSLPHSILPPLFTTGTSPTPGAATPQLIPQPQMLMPLVLNGLQTQTQIQGQNSESPNQLLQQAVPVLGLSAAQQALLAQRLSGLQSQWAAFGLPTTHMSLEEANKKAEKNIDMGVQGIKVEPCDQQMSLNSEEDWKIDGVKKDLSIKTENTQGQSEDEGTFDEKEHEESEMDIERSNENVCEGEDANSKVTKSSVAPVLQHGSPLSCVLDPNQGLSRTHNVSSPGIAKFTFRNTNFALRSAGHRSAKDYSLLSSGRPVLTEFQSQVLWAFLESRDDAETSSPQREDCEALGREVGLSGEEVRKWFLDAWQSKDRERLDSFHDDRDTSMEEEEGNLMIDESEDGHSPSATGSHAIDLSSSGERHRIGKGSPRELLLTSDSENEEFYTSVIVTDEESQSSSMREESGSPIKQSSQVEPTAERSSGGGKVLRSTTVFLSDAEDEYDDEQSMKRKRRRSEIAREEVEIKREKQDVDLDLQLEAQADPPTPLSVAVDQQGVPAGILQSLPLSLSLGPLSTQLYSPYVLSLPSSVIGVGISEGDRGKIAFSNTHTITRSPASALSDPLNAPSTAHSFLSNGNDCESALDLSMGKNHSSTLSTSSVSTANKPSIQKSHLLDGLGLRPATVGVPTEGGLIVVQVKPDSAIAIPSSTNSTITNRNNLVKTSTVYMRAAEKVSTSLMEREKEKEREKERDQKRPKVRRFRDMRRSRTIIHADQLDILYGCYFKDPNPGKHEFEQISEWVNLPKKVVQIWFQNMRARERKGEVRFISDGTLAAVGKPLIKFTWPLSKPIFSTPPKSNPSPSTGWTPAKPQTGNLPPKVEKVKEVKEPLKTPPQGPSRPNQTASFTLVSTSPSLVQKIKTEAAPITMVKIAPKTVATPVAVPLLVSGIPTSRPATKSKAEEVQAESEHTDEEDDNYKGGVESGTTSLMVPKLTTTPINKPAALASQKHNGLKFWSHKSPFKINTLSREQLGLSSQRPTLTTTTTTTSTTTTTLNPTPTPTTPSTLTVTASSGQSQKEISYMQHNSTPRRPRTHLTSLQLSILQSCYETCAHPNALECEAVGTELGLPLKVVQIWFQNTRAKEKRWRLQQEKMSPNPSDPSKRIDVSSGSYLQYNALRANRPILPKPVQLTVVDPAPSYTIGQTAVRETLVGKCEACGAEFESRAAARDHVFSARHLATLRTTNFGLQASMVSNGSGTGSTGIISQSSTPSPASSSS